MKRTPLIRKTPIADRQQFVARVVVGAAIKAKKRLRQSRSTGKPTKAESRRIDQLKTGECLCCWLNRQQGRPTAHFGGCDAHHVLSGGRRIGHMATLGLCPWHHRALRPYADMTDAQATELFGPSLALGSKPFHAAYGSDEELLALQEQLLACGVSP
ncbi:MAG: hypothetical protein GAK28_03207 [Luteibacter sp.]|nr:MAG: hypothetical protein GAK28_03207 [Luteibacter sp.]